MAARLCSVAAPGEIRASQGLVHLAGPTDGLTYRPLDAQTFKGIPEPVAAVGVTSSAEPAAGPLTAPMPAQPAATPLPPELEPLVPLAGRTAELLWLRWHWRRARHGHGRKVVLSGPPGIGKTRLSAELATIVQGQGGTVRYLPSGQGAGDSDPDRHAEGTPTLLIVDDLDAAASSLLQAVAEVSNGTAARPRLLLITHREEAAAALVAVVERLTPRERRRALGSLEPEAVRSIAAMYAGRAIGELPLGQLTVESGGVPAVVHRLAARWARSSATRRLSASADRTEAGRRGLRAAEEELIGDVSDLELARERSRLYGAESDDPAAGQAALTVCPYKGLAAFEAADADYFFGRERLVAELVARLVGSPFLGLVGASGSGKSSALRAGLLPAIAGGVLPGSDHWMQVLLRPGEHPLEELSQALARATPQEATSSDVASTPDAAGRLEAALARLDPGQELVLVVDQFEELFGATRGDNERDAFIDLLTTERRGLKVIITLRADHYGHCAAYPALARLLGGSHVLVGPLTTAELASVIEHPAERVGLRVEPALTEALIADAGTEPGVLPLLSTSLLELWQARDGGRLTLAAYRASGGLHGAVARLAEAAYGELNPGQQAITRSILLRLAGPGEGEGVVRRRVPLDELDADRDPAVAQVLETLTSARLLTSGDGYVEVAHEALLREWPRLHTWLEEDAAGRLLRVHLMGAVRDWQQRGREPGDLYRGARLATALDWAAEHQVELNTAEREYLLESRLASERDVERQRRTNRRLRGLLAGAAVLLVVAVGAGVVAVTQLGRAQDESRRAEEEGARAQQNADQAEQERLRAEEQAEVARQEAEAARTAETFARAKELAASALSVLGDDPSLSKLLAVAAGSLVEPDVATEAVLHRVWASDPVIDRYTWPGEEAPWTDLDPSGQLILASGASRGPDTHLEVIDWATDEILWEFDPEAAQVVIGQAFFSVDGAHVVAGTFWDPGDAEPSSEPPPSDALGLHVWDARTGRLVDRFDVGGCGGEVIAISATSVLVNSAHVESATPTTCFGDAVGNPIELVDLSSGQRQLLAEDSFGDAKLSRDGRFVALTEVTDGAQSFVLDVATGERSLEIDPEDISRQARRYVRGLSDDGSLLLYGDQPMQTLDVATGEVIASLGSVSGESFWADFAPSSPTVYATNRDATLRLYDAMTGQEIFALPAAGGGRSSASEVGLLLAMDDSTRTASIVDPRPKGEIDTIRTCAGFSGAGSLTIVDDLALFVTECADGNWDTLVVDLVTNEDLLAFPGHIAQDTAVSPDGTRFAQQESGPDHRVLSPLRIRDVRSGDLVVEMEGLCSWDAFRPREEAVDCNAFPEVPFALQNFSLEWSPDGSMLAATDHPAYDGYIAVWDTQTGEILHVASPPADSGFWEMIFTPDSKRLIASTTGGELLVFSTETWQVIDQVVLDASIDGSGSIGFAGFLADGSTLVAVGGSLGGGGGWLHRIDLATLEVLGSNQAHDGAPKSMTISPDGSLVATGASDGIVRVWEGPTGTLLHEIPIEGQAQGVAFVDDRHLAVAPQDGGLLIFTLDSQELLDVVGASLTRGFTQTECDRFGFADACPSLEEMKAPLTGLGRDSVASGPLRSGRGPALGSSSWAW